jgi:hypothetical protein
MLRFTGMVMMAALSLAVAAPAYAQDEAVSTSYLTPFPENDLYRMQIVGDAYAEGILGGLVETLGPETRIEVPRKPRPFAGFSRRDAEDDLKAFEDQFARDTYHIAVVMAGTADRSSIRNPRGEQLKVGTREWVEIYGRRVDRMMKSLRRKQTAVYWVGLPVLKLPQWNDDVQMINEIIREKALMNGIRYIDAYAGFVDDSGNYDPWGPDLTGKMRKMRDGDGILFTADGNRKLAHFVERELRRDLTQARSDRTVPLLGSEAEQRRVAPKPPAAADGGPAKAPGLVAVIRPAAAAPIPVDPSGEQRADNGRVSLRVVGAQGKEETVILDIVRPAIAANVVALLTRQQSPDKAAQLGDTLTDEISGGLLVMSSITPSVTAGNRSKLTPSQTPYFRVMVKGERLPPKPGRVDDFAWPRTDMTPEERPVSPEPPAARPPAGAGKGPTFKTGPGRS